MQVFVYYSNFPNDRRLQKIIVRFRFSFMFYIMSKLGLIVHCSL